MIDKRTRSSPVAGKPKTAAAGALPGLCLALKAIQLWASLAYKGKN
jgi:hypothetical protein